MREIGKRDPLVADLRRELAHFLVRQLEERLEQAKLVHDLQRRGMDGIAAEVAQEVRMLFEHGHLDARAREQKSEHHACGSAAGDAASGDHGLRRHGLPNIPVMAGLVPAIHVFSRQQQIVDARHRAGHDEVVLRDEDHCSLRGRDFLPVMRQVAEARLPPVQRVLWIPAIVDDTEARRERVVQQKSPGETFADLQKFLHHLDRRKRADDAGDGAEDASLRAGRHRPRRRSVRKKATI